MKVAVIMGSDSDWDVMAPAVEVLIVFAIEYEVVVASAHRTPGKVHEFAEEAAGLQSHRAFDQFARRQPGAGRHDE